MKRKRRDGVQPHDRIATNEQGGIPKMVTRSEVQVQEKRKQAKPDMDLLHHLACVRPSQEASVTVKLNDGRLAVLAG